MRACVAFLHGRVHFSQTTTPPYDRSCFVDVPIEFLYTNRGLLLPVAGPYIALKNAVNDGMKPDSLEINRDTHYLGALITPKGRVYEIRLKLGRHGHQNEIESISCCHEPYGFVSHGYADQLMMLYAIMRDDQSSSFEKIIEVMNKTGGDNKVSYHTPFTSISFEEAVEHAKKAVESYKPKKEVKNE